MAPPFPVVLGRALALAAALALPSGALAADAKPSVAVLDFAANGASKELASAAGGVAANELDRIGAFRVMTMEAIRSLLAFDRQRQMLGCNDASCAGDVGGALGVDWLVTGRITRLPGSVTVPGALTLDLSLMNVKRSAREGSAVETAVSEAELMTKVGRAVRKLVSKLLADRSGSLIVTSGEVGAAVKVDDQLQGTTPMQGALRLPGGPHLVTVEKQGFVTWQKDVQIEPSRPVQEHVLLVPSPDFAREYHRRNARLRAGAWISSGVAVTAFVGAVLLQASAERLYGNESTPGTFLYDRRRLQDGVTTESGVDLRNQASSLKSRITTRQNLSYVSAAVGGVATISAVALWIAGEDPRKYDAFRQATAGLDVAPLPGGAVASLSLGF